MNIDERAIAWSEQHRDIYWCNADVIAELSYKQGAIDQRQIDDEEYRKDMRYINIKKQELIDKACEAFCIESKCRNRVNLSCRQTCEKLKCFRDAITME